ncbi:hypothetical protein [Clostridium kluyveri]|uniref:Aspartate ammonia-lyase n=2 Tax=Clostridium kluyveri TaxID=1534 RepID=A5N9C3_CLOK5|nr:hypothetical protein [Clostridium kluyveri]EDK33904.1 Conserved hypothetical protein [Clostridium kluyveri DSM 555]BAH06779.1 hypothetical protein CKR_1728 [Clostridium kluyveri NBRC 12016]
MVKIYSIDSLREAKKTQTIDTVIPFKLNGKEYLAPKKIVNGEMETYVLTKPIGEMLRSNSLAQYKDLLKKVVLDVELGREQIPLLYSPIYDLLSDPTMPKLIDAKWALTGTVVFTEHMEGEEVKFGALQVEYGPTARLLTYTAGFEYTKEMKDFNDNFSVDILNRSMGEAYNALLNHIYLSPIINYTYKTANKTPYQGSADEDVWVRYYKTLTQAIIDCNKAKRPGTVLLASSMNKDNIEMALKGGYQINGTTYPAVSGISSIVYYDGWATQVGRKSYSYPGVTDGKCYLIRPKRGFKELLKQDLQIESQAGDLSRLVEQQIVGYAYRGCYAAIDENVQEITLG